jgi:DNA-binding CsgD family transcriptional regulator
MCTHILTKTEDLVIRLKLMGLSRKEIAEITERSAGTIQRHFQNIYEKLEIKSEIELYNWYVENILGINIRMMFKGTEVKTLNLFHKAFRNAGVLKFKERQPGRIEIN